MVRYFSRAFPLLVAATLVALPATAELYTVRLKNGTAIASRQQPQVAAWDKNLLLVLTEVGNWAALEIKGVEKVDVETEVRGFAQRLNSNTVFLGWSANDGTGDRGGVVLPPAQRSFDQQQFVDPSEAGGGFPTTLSYSGSGESGGGGASNFVPPQAPAPPPAEAPPQQ